MDRLWWAHTIRRAAIVDCEFVAAQLGHRLSPARAVRRYVRGGFRDGLALNPLFVEATVSRQLSDADRVPALYAYLKNDRRLLVTSPNWDAPAYAARVPESLTDPAGPLGHAWRTARRVGSIPLGPSSHAVVVDWRKVHETACAAARETLTGSLHARGGSKPASTTFVCLVDGHETDADQALLLASGFGGEAASVRMTILSPPAWLWSQAAILTLWRDRLAVDTTEDANALATMIADVSTGTIVVREAGAEISAEALELLSAAGAERPTAPLWLAEDGTVASAGVALHRGAAVRILRGYPEEDALRAGTSIDVAALDAPVYARPAQPSAPSRPRTLTSLTVIAAISARAMPSPVPGGVEVELADALATSGLRPGPRSASGGPLLIRPSRRHRLPDGTEVPSLRWAIKTAAPAGPRGNAWGDRHFAHGIARALRALGQDAVVDSYAARNRTTGDIDDVDLVLRGPQPIITPRRGARSLLWVISHPDEVTPAEIDRFDRVFAASVSWATHASSRFGTPISPLLQCTDPGVFRPSGRTRTSEIVFVGTARGIARPSVVAPIEAGIPVDVYGPDWRGYIRADRIVSTGIRQADLAELYGRAGVVLNDHWPAMRREGFISNRPYDVIASGGRVISDRVTGIEDHFSGAVQTYTSVDQLIAMLAGDLDSLFPDEDALAKVSRRVRERDSFSARARELLDAALS